MPRLMPPVLEEARLRSMTFPTLLHDGLLLRPFSSGDANAVLAAYTDTDIQRWHVRAMSTLVEAEQWIVEGHAQWEIRRRLEWAVDSDGVMVGRVCLRSLDLLDGCGEVGYWVLPSARGRNVAVRALHAITRWSFGELGLHRLGLEHSTANPASCRVAEKAGFFAEGTRRASVRHADGWHDMHQHGRIVP